MLNRKVLIKKAEKLDKYWKQLVNVFVLNLRTWRLDRHFTRYLMQDSNAFVYWKFIELNWKFDWKNYINYIDFKKEYLKSNVDNIEDFYVKKQKKLDDYFEDKWVQTKINTNFKKVFNNLNLFLNINESVFNKSLNFLKNEEKNFDKEKVLEIKKHFLFSTIYWTTKMEDSKLSNNKAKKIFNNKEWVKNFDEKEFSNLKKAFKFIDQSVEIDLLKVKEIHISCSSWLDEIKPKDELNFKSWVFRSESVLMLWVYQTPFYKNMWDIVENILINTEKLNWIWKIIYFHLFFYLLHPFYNWNKRTTRVLEYFYFKEEFSDVYDKFIWMWYYFFKEKKAYFSFINQILISNYSEKSIKDFINFYIFSFNEMLELSLKEIKIKEIQDNKNFSNELEKEFNEFLLRNEIFKLSDLRIFLNKKLIKKNMLKSISLEEELKKDNNVELIDIDWKIFQSKIYVK